jgi:hypothetical protein
MSNASAGSIYKPEKWFPDVPIEVNEHAQSIESHIGNRPENILG